MSPNLRQVQSDTARRQQAMRDLSGLPWAPRTANRTANWLSLFAFALLAVSIWAFVTRPPAAPASTARGPSVHAGADKGQGSSQ